MDIKPAEMTPANMHRATRTGLDIIQEMQERLLNMTADPLKTQRLNVCKCVVCYYRGPRIAGAAITRRPCMRCKTVLNFGSTKTDVLCNSCASDTGLCVECGADVNLVIREEWPKPFYVGP